MILVCPDVATCRTAAQRVTDAPSSALGVDIEGSTRQRIPAQTDARNVALRKNTPIAGTVPKASRTHHDDVVAPSPASPSVASLLAAAGAACAGCCSSDSATPTSLRRASTPMVDAARRSRHRQVQGRWCADAREHRCRRATPIARWFSHAVRMSQRLGVALRDGRAIAPRTQVLKASNMSSVALAGTLAGGPWMSNMPRSTSACASPPRRTIQRYAGGQPPNITPTVGQVVLARAPNGD